MSLIDDKWRILFDKYRIEREIEKHGRFYITADQIREVKEPRLMTKFDTRESLPRVFGKKISILPVSRGGYVLGELGSIPKDGTSFCMETEQLDIKVENIAGHRAESMIVSKKQTETAACRLHAR